MTTKQPLLLVICGPTASGKTDIAVALARKFNSEVISSDSRQFYREMTVGTAVPSEDQQCGVSHHFIGNLSIHDPFNVYQYETEVLKLLHNLYSYVPLVLMAGGSGLYINAVCHGIDLLPDPDPKIRAQLKQLFDKEGLSALQLLVKTLDPDYFEKVDRSNPVRLIRAIEVCLATGVPYSSLRGNHVSARPFRVLKVGLNLPREILNQRINDRVDSMMKNGLLEEAQSLYQFRNLQALNTVGYRELFEYFDGLRSLEEAVEKIKTNTRRYAKRQMTWFSRDKEIFWFEPNQLNEISSFVEKMLNQPSIVKT